ncbi:hypothetical protein FOQG_01805 [Fusarium oxysporum f. sp. raphani 54005]|jgi:hypothetical protein|uniref:Uncharacterized protein n=6 Tax=Fusarium oxysporum TaxID=5507 RepID=X0D7W3_FUSOX|nr:hypothetical protein FOWG_09418 [Fusarium oxysporum f. sp. lycopersici MN25]EXA41096.1 hypothetical protein FOVG_09652 [Fusarium oxysporum f. sp. pisi HDV247]EXK99219.1 hypothetical protein FOQG_01805 [Fusarium oxysporum f. sp. raphani 54005]EXL44780.1 hypothetical protein FOCG_13676 [Fusarium oxysporum f. sp. radicis-lycopersici 26381]EXL88110.1 hypothetical protein FOPG_01074 [Fusarium oxysporum f. sp. conglutinans race 2 54008]EXM34608.1 hypothetical protein FOTG_01397 [Fusarium oxysporu
MHLHKTMLQGPMVGFHDSNGRLITTDFMPDQPLVLQVNKAGAPV